MPDDALRLATPSNVVERNAGEISRAVFHSLFHTRAKTASPRLRAIAHYDIGPVKISSSCSYILGGRSY